MRRFENHFLGRRKAGRAPVYFGLSTAVGAIVIGLAATPDATANGTPARPKTPSCEERFGADFVPIVLRAPGERRRVICAVLPALAPDVVERTAP